MAKKNADLFDMLRASGVRKRVAKTLTDASKTARGNRKPPKAAKRALTDLRAVVAEIEDRVNGGPQKRKLAAKKAAATRKRKAAKRSAAAKKGARTRAKSGR